MPLLTIILAIVLLAASYASYKTRRLTAGGALTGAVVALFIYLGTGIPGILMLAAFFIMGVWATSHSKSKKMRIAGVSYQQSRDARQVLANGGFPALLGLLAYIFPDNTVLASILMAAAFASASADTVSSELGVVYGKHFYNILNFKPDDRGRDGVVSLQGTLAGLAGSIVIACIYALSFQWDRSFIFIIIAGNIGNLADSVLGATLERRGLMNNNEVNFLNTFIAAACCCLFLLVL